MKHSLNNQIVSQVMLSGLLDNVVCMPVLTWRIVSCSPLHSTIAVITTFVYQFYRAWIVLTFIELAVFKTLMVNKFSRMAGIDDIFMGRFLLIANIFLLLLTNFGRLWIGGIHESPDYQILTGNIFGLKRLQKSCSHMLKLTYF